MFFSVSFNDIEIGLIISLISVCVGILFLLLNLISGILSGINKRKWKSNVSYYTLVKETVQFTNDILYQKGIKYFPRYRISHYHHKKHMGVLNGSEIVIYIKNHINVPDIVDTVLHEIAHYIQKCLNPQAFNRASSPKKNGMVDNSLEKEACQFAEKWLEQCMDYLLDRKIIRKGG
jgi:hypothetical protein